MDVLRQHQCLRRTVDHLRKRHLNLRILFAPIFLTTREVFILVIVKEYAVRGMLRFVGPPRGVAERPTRVANISQSGRIWSFRNIAGAI